jgi:hypothetical protein
VRFVVRMLKVRLAVQVDQAVAASAPQSQERDQENAAITAQDHRRAVSLQPGLNRIGQRPRYLADAGRVENPGGGIAPVVVRRNRDLARIGAA